ncbi:MAG TPA: tetratricopeptide repeat protein [Rhodospirillaceae bacterium]|nr:tetratricopeptide repeat protein [Rhodospirillaceae bacterium]
MSTAFAEAKAMYLEGRFFDCLDACEKILAKDPGHADTLNVVGLLCFRGGDSTAAEHYFRECVRHSPEHAEGHANLALMLKQRGDLADALDSYKVSVRLNPNDAQAQLNYGLALRAIFQSAKAAEALQQAAELNPFLPDVFNTLGLTLIDLNRTSEAGDAFRKAIAAQPGAYTAYRNLAAVLVRTQQIGEAVDLLRWAIPSLGLATVGPDLVELMTESGQTGEAISVLRDLVETAPSDAGAWEQLGTLLLRQGRFAESLAALQRAVAEDDGRASAHMRIFSVAQILDQPDLALAHQQRALARTRLYSETGGNAGRPTLLIVKAAGDWQANLPTEFIIRNSDWNAVHTYFVDPDQGPDLNRLPRFDLILNALGEADLLERELAVVAALRDTLPTVPFFNDPLRIARSGRQTMAEDLSGIADCLVPASFRLAVTGAVAAICDLIGQGRLSFPLVIRPVGTHAGQGMLLVSDLAELEAAVSGIDREFLYVVQFVDYRSADGLFRKYRVSIVDGTPYPFHMAVSKRWMVHYYNAEIDDHSQMDREEEHFLAHFDDVFGEAPRQAIAEIHRRVGLDIFALDCAIGRDGRLIVFEVAVNAIIHLMEDPQKYAYKHKYVPRIFDAVRAMLTRPFGG